MTPTAAPDEQQSDATPDAGQLITSTAAVSKDEADDAI
jgi:hypothetical protein